MQLKVKIRATEVKRNFRKISKKFDDPNIPKLLQPLAKEFIKEAIKSPIPYRTGKLSRSSFITVGNKWGQIYFGFSVNDVPFNYAYAQDIGSTWYPPLKPKPYGSIKGPNKYFTGTLNKMYNVMYPRIVMRIQKTLTDTLGFWT